MTSCPRRLLTFLLAFAIAGPVLVLSAPTAGATAPAVVAARVGTGTVPVAGSYYYAGSPGGCLWIEVAADPVDVSFAWDNTDLFAGIIEGSLSIYLCESTPMASANEGALVADEPNNADVSATFSPLYGLGLRHLTLTQVDTTGEYLRVGNLASITKRFNYTLHEWEGGPVMYSGQLTLRVEVAVNSKVDPEDHYGFTYSPLAWQCAGPSCSA